MKNFFSRLMLVLNYGSEIDDILREAHNEKAKEKAIQESKKLDLCFDHQQRSVGSHYSEHNCDYCRLLKEKEELERKINVAL